MLTAQPETIACGIHADLDEAEYHALVLASKTYLVALHRQSPMHAKHAIDNPEDSPSLAIGRAVHCLVLEGEPTFQRNYLISSRCTATKKDGDRCTNNGVAFVAGKWVCGVHVRKDRHEEALKSVVARYVEEYGFRIDKVSESESHYLSHPDGRKARIANHAASHSE